MAQARTRFFAIKSADRRRSSYCLLSDRINHISNTPPWIVAALITLINDQIYCVFNFLTYSQDDISSHPVPLLLYVHFYVLTDKLYFLELIIKLPCIENWKFLDFFASNTRQMPVINPHPPPSEPETLIIEPLSSNLYVAPVPELIFYPVSVIAVPVCLFVTLGKVSI